MRIVRCWMAAAVVGLLLAGCGASPGGGGDDTSQKAQKAKENSKKIDVAKAGNVTLTVWDQEVRGGQAKQIKQLNAAFQAKYPNVKIKRVAKSFDDLNTTLKLAVSGSKAPDVVQANQGRQVMGQLVKGGLLTPLDAYAEAYGWADRYSKVLLDLNRFSDDGKQFGSGSLYGLSQMGEIVGVFYNKDKVSTPPATFADFESQLDQAKGKGDVPISFGNLDPFAGIHEFQTVQNQFADKQAVRDFVFAKDGASFATPENEQAATKLQEWAKKDYFTPDFNGTGYDPAWQQFAKGKGPFLIAGTWLTADLADNMGDKVGFMLMPPKEEGGDPVSLGG
jgi:raffinose/stachyose/melibiose transport system substrate-binding protein